MTCESCGATDVENLTWYEEIEMNICNYCLEHFDAEICNELD